MRCCRITGKALPQASVAELSEEIDGSICIAEQHVAWAHRLIVPSDLSPWLALRTCIDAPSILSQLAGPLFDEQAVWARPSDLRGLPPAGQRCLDFGACQTFR